MGVPSSINKTNSGFTLIELLLVVAIIGLLAAIAIPQFVVYRTRAIDTQMKNDLKNAAMAMESYFAEFKIYPASVGSISSAGYRQTSGINLVISVTSPSSFTLTASTPNGSQPSFTYDSVTGTIN
jgi:prepilin-type N-terminal cleavage/methylation domain-containing protein